MERSTRRLQRNIFILRLTFYICHFLEITTSKNRQSPKVLRFIFPSHSMEKRILSQADASIAHLFSIWSTHTEKLLSKKKSTPPTAQGKGGGRRRFQIVKAPVPSRPGKKYPVRVNPSLRCNKFSLHMLRWI